MATGPLPRQLTTFDCCAIIEGFSGDDHTEEDVIDAFQHLINTGAIWHLQGSYGRAAAHLIESGVCYAPDAAEVSQC